MEKPIYLVWCPQTSNVLTVKHDTFTGARFEARRLAEQTPGNDFFVLRAVESVCYKPSPFVTIMYSQDER